MMNEKINAYYEEKKREALILLAELNQDKTYIFQDNAIMSIFKAKFLGIAVPDEINTDKNYVYIRELTEDKIIKIDINKIINGKYTITEDNDNNSNL